MNCKFTNVFMFAAGAIIGSAATWFVLKNKYEQRIQEEVESVKEALSGLTNDTDKPAEETESEDEEDAEEYHQVNWDELEDLDEEEPDEELEEYANLTNLYSSEKGGAEKVKTKKPYVISPYDFGEVDEFRKIDLTYYADGVLADEDDEIVSDVDELIGAGSLNTFGEYEDDAVFVRNEYLMTDFEILKDYRTYEEATGVSPRQVSK